MPKIEFRPTETETISNFKELIHYEELEQVLTKEELLKGQFDSLNKYLTSLDKLVEFKPVFIARESILKFDRSKHLMSKSAFAKELEKVKEQYEEHEDAIDEDSSLFNFLAIETSFFARRYRPSNNQPDIIFVDFDGCNQTVRLDAKPTLCLLDQDIISKVVDTIFNYCFKVDKTNEWAKVACEYSLRESLGIEDKELETKLEKLTDYMRHGVDVDTAEKLFLYKDMVEEKTNKDGTKFWRVGLPKREDADRAWINLKHENVSEHDDDTDMVKVFLVKDTSYSIHYLKDSKLETKWADSDKEIIPPLKVISDKYKEWIEDSKTPTFTKKLSALEVGKDTEDFVIAINDGEKYIAIHFMENEGENEIQGSLYNNTFHLEDGTTFTIQKDDETLKIIGRIFDRLLGMDARKTASLAKCNRTIFEAKVAENKLISDYKVIAAVDEMNVSDNNRNDLIKVIAKKAS